MTHMDTSPSEKHLLEHLRTSMRVASDRLAEAERKERAYVALIESFERKLTHARQAQLSARVWMWVAWGMTAWLGALLALTLHAST